MAVKDTAPPTPYSLKNSEPPWHLDKSPFTSPSSHTLFFYTSSRLHPRSVRRGEATGTEAAALALPNLGCKSEIRSKPKNVNVVCYE